jgi:hypothetical protein
MIVTNTESPVVVVLRYALYIFMNISLYICIAGAWNRLITEEISCF